MKFLAYIVLMLLAALAFFVYEAAQQSITIDHLKMAVRSLEKREACLLRLSRPFAASMSREELRRWIQANLSDLDVHDEEALILVNEVAFDLAQHPASIE